VSTLTSSARYFRANSAGKKIVVRLADDRLAGLAEGTAEVLIGHQVAPLASLKNA
jgi:hypothetical protein